MSGVRKTARVPLEAAGRRLDQAAADMFPEFSRSRLAAWVKQGALRVDGEQVVPRHRLHGGESLELDAELQPEVEWRPQAIALDIRYQDADLLVLDKPAGLVVHPGAGNRDGTLLNALLHRDPALAELPRAGIVHRLDKDTSGLMVVARSQRARTKLVSMLSEHRVARSYLAIVQGKIIAGGTVDAPLGRHRADRLRQAVREDAGGKRAVTHYRVLERYAAHTLLRCELETGRTHQIRVHMAHIGHALVGDPRYAKPRPPRGASAALLDALGAFRRQALHAQRLAFAHPVTAELLTFEAEPPADLRELLEVLRTTT